ncbi:MAG TPA: PLP-dependent aminotransferase family protein [Chitinophagales bacterium]|nr:PLP-dependent aminotransferase family protein [Chitinophagales bacterium]
MQNLLPQKDFLYHEVAERFERLINDHVLKSGDKLLSVRSLSKEQGVSMSTAFQAYSILENKGLIEAREKSGYYVKFSPREFPQIPHHEISMKEARKTSVDDMIAEIHKNISAENILKFSLAAPSLELLPAAKLNKAVVQAIRSSKDSCLGYENIQGNELLRNQIAKYAFNWGGFIHEDDVVITGGCQEAIMLCLKAVTKPGDTVAVESPTYFGIFNMIQSLGLKVIEIPTSAAEGVNLQYLKSAIAKFKIKACLFVTNFNNPFGSCLPDEKKKKLVQLLAPHNIPLIEDDIYGEMYFGRKRPRTCKSFDKKGLVLLCSSVSKSLAPGYRVGWCVPGKFKDKIIRLKVIHSISTPTITQAAIGLFMQNGRYELHLRRLRKALHTQCLRYIQAITQFFPEDTKISRPQGGYVLWIELNKNVNAMELYQRAMKHKISISPGQIFSTGARFENCVRISFGRPYDAEVERGLKRLGGLVREMAG